MEEFGDNLKKVTPDRERNSTWEVIMNKSKSHNNFLVNSHLLMFTISRGTENVAFIQDHRGFLHREVELNHCCAENPNDTLMTIIWPASHWA